jgi:predicted phosphodiesterase
MRYAFISDVHANIEALTAALGAIDRIGADRILCLGDVVGRFANPNEVIDTLCERAVRTIAGNHDRAALGTGSDSDFTSRAKRSNAWTRAHLAPSSVRFLRGLPVLDEVDDHLLMVHAGLDPSPNDHDYLTSSDKITRSLNKLRHGEHGVHLAFFGHTHLPGVHRMWTRGATAGGLMSAEDTWQKLYPDSVYLINPGSVGQPRDGDPRASFLIYDRDHAIVRFHRVEFDRRASHEKALREGLMVRGEEYLV